MDETGPGTRMVRVPGLATVLADFGRPVVVPDTPNVTLGFAYQFGTLGVDGHLWGVRAELVRSGVSTSVVLTARDIPGRVVPYDRDVLLEDTLSEFAANASIAAGLSALEQSRAEVAAQEALDRTLVIDGEPHPAVAKRCRGQVGVAARYLDLVVVAVAPEEEIDGLRLASITRA